MMMVGSDGADKMVGMVEVMVWWGRDGNEGGVGWGGFGWCGRVQAPPN